MLKNIYLIVGASGTGKSTLVEELVKKYNGVEVLSYTDRLPRYKGEGTHIFVSPEKFTELLPMIAYTEFDGHRYGVTQDIFDKSDFYVIDPAGIIFLYKHYKGNKPIKIVGLVAENQILKRRLIARDGKEDRFYHDAKIFTPSVMELLCDTIIDSSYTVESTIYNTSKFIEYCEGEEL